MCAVLFAVLLPASVDEAPLVVCVAVVRECVCVCELVVLRVWHVRVVF